MTITCPHCGFSRDLDESRLPDRPVRLTCPRCRESFPFQPGEVLADAGRDEQEKRTTCLGCGLEQPARDFCRGCGLSLARPGAPEPDRPVGPGAEDGTPSGAGSDPAALPKAGFWIRAAACLLDNLLLGATLLVLNTLLLAAAIFVSGDVGSEMQRAMGLIINLFSMVFSLTYFVFFTGYCGQTPGKMALRLRVIRSDGGGVGYGRAFLREVIGKFLSAAILFIGYLMVAFHPRKQGLHDLVADTCVIKLPRRT